MFEQNPDGVIIKYCTENGARQYHRRQIQKWEVTALIRITLEIGPQPRVAPGVLAIDGFDGLDADTEALRGSANFQMLTLNSMLGSIPASGPFSACQYVLADVKASLHRQTLCQTVTGQGCRWNRTCGSFGEGCEVRIYEADELHRQFKVL